MEVGMSGMLMSSDAHSIWGRIPGNCLWIASAHSLQENGSTEVYFEGTGLIENFLKLSNEVGREPHCSEEVDTRPAQAAMETENGLEWSRTHFSRTLS